MKAIVNTDGGARGNPGPAACAVIIKNPDTNLVVKETGRFLGVATNNQAEYEGLLLGFAESLKLQIKYIDFFLDSELIVKQLKGEYRVKDVTLQTLYKKAKELERRFDKVTYNHVPRSHNKEADKLLNQILDAQI